MIGLGIPIHSIHTSSTTVEAKKPPKAQIPEPETKDLLQTGTTLITHPIRSGQRVYAAGDLVIIAPVSPGTEILAEGNNPRLRFAPRTPISRCARQY